MQSATIPTRHVTMAETYHAICVGAPPWVALSEFLHAWFEAASSQRLSLVDDPIVEPDLLTADQWRWAVFCAAGVVWLCEQASLVCPSWALNHRFRLDAQWYDFDSPGAHKRAVRAWLKATTPAPFARRNIYCGDRVFANKYDFAARFGRRGGGATNEPTANTHDASDSPLA